MFSSSSLLSISDSKTCITLCISFDKTVYSFGSCLYGSHGNKEFKILYPKQIKLLYDIKMIDCGLFHTICLDYNGDIFSFGRNNKGQLGINKDKNELPFTHKIQKINLSRIKQVSCGPFYTICLSENGKLYSFGDNYEGQLGIGTTDDKYKSPQLIHGIDNVEYIKCGGIHVICKTYDNEYYSWGDNEFGQLGQGHTNNCNKPTQCLNWPDNIINIKSGYYHSLLLTLEGNVYSFGFNSDGQLGFDAKYATLPVLIKDLSKIQRIECGNDHSMCIDINNNLWLFGDNTCGQLGLGDTDDRYKPIIHPTLSNIIDISSGGNHTFVKTIDNKIYAFGHNNCSQLGIETLEEKQLTPIQVLVDKEKIWCSTIGKSKQKSARK